MHQCRIFVDETFAIQMRFKVALKRMKKKDITTTTNHNSIEQNKNLCVECLALVPLNKHFCYFKRGEKKIINLANNISIQLKTVTRTRKQHSNLCIK